MKISQEEQYALSVGLSYAHLHESPAWKHLTGFLEDECRKTELEAAAEEDETKFRRRFIAWQERKLTLEGMMAHVEMTLMQYNQIKEDINHVDTSGDPVSGHSGNDTSLPGY